MHIFFSDLFPSKCKQILYLPTMYIYLFCKVKSQQQQKLPNRLNRGETNIILIVFDGVLCEIHTYTATVSYSHLTCIGYQKSYILISDRI